MTPSQIIAATFTVIFEGLVAFVGDSATEKTHVAITNAPGHAAFVVVNARYFELRKGDVITFGLPAGPATTTDSFDTRVPNLAEYIVAGDLHDDVKDQTHPNDGVIAFVTLSPGTLAAEGRFTHPAIFTKRDGTIDTRCIARYVRFESVAPGNVTVTIAGPNRPAPMIESVPANGTVHIGNVPSTPGMHFHAFNGLLNRPGRVGTVSEHSGYCEDGGSRREGRTFRVTTNLPNGDCGPVDYP